MITGVTSRLRSQRRCDTQFPDIAVRTRPSATISYASNTTSRLTSTGISQRSSSIPTSSILPHTVASRSPPHHMDTRSTRLKACIAAPPSANKPPRQAAPPSRPLTSLLSVNQTRTGENYDKLISPCSIPTQTTAPTGDRLKMADPNVIKSCARFPSTPVNRSIRRRGPRCASWAGYSSSR